MEEPSDFIKKIVQFIKSNDFDNATISITEIKDENDERYDVILESIIKLFSTGAVSKEKTTEILQQLINIYKQNKDDSKKLKNEVNAILSKFGLIGAKTSKDQEFTELSSWTDIQLKEKIRELQQQQQNLLNEGKGLDPKIGESLNRLLEEQGHRSGYKGKQIEEEESDNQKEGERPEGADVWFVTPSEEQLLAKIKTYVISGSPIIKNLRNRYIK